MSQARNTRHLLTLQQSESSLAHTWTGTWVLSNEAVPMHSKTCHYRIFLSVKEMQVCSVLATIDTFDQKCYQRLITSVLHSFANLVKVEC